MRISDGVQTCALPIYELRVIGAEEISRQLPRTPRCQIDGRVGAPSAHSELDRAVAEIVGPGEKIAIAPDGVEYVPVAFRNLVLSARVGQACFVAHSVELAWHFVPPGPGVHSAGSARGRAGIDFIRVIPKCS